MAWSITKMNIQSMIAAEIEQYDQNKRQATIKISGLTDGATNLPIADILYSLGDDPSKTEIELLQGDKVWIVFQGGDTRKPIIIGFRCPQTNNINNKRYWHKENIELVADETMKFLSPAIFAQCENLTITATQATNITTPTLTVVGQTIFNGGVTFNQGAEVAQGSFAVSNGNITVPMGNISTSLGGYNQHYHIFNGINSSPPQH